MYQLRLLLERGTLARAFRYLQDYLAREDVSGILDPHVKTAARVSHEKLLEEKFAALDAENSDETYDLRQPFAVSLNAVRPRSISTDIYLDPGDGERFRLELTADLLETFLLFPRLFGSFNMLVLNVRAADLREDGEAFPHAWVRAVLQMVNCLKPFYGFSDMDNTVHSKLVWLYEMSENERADYRPTFRAEPWNVFDRTMIYGRKRIAEVGRAHLLAAPAAYTLELPNLIALWGPRGLLDEGEVPLTHLRHDFHLEREYLNDYGGTLADYLGVYREPWPLG